jgi:hypothetical protein
MRATALEYDAGVVGHRNGVRKESQNYSIFNALEHTIIKIFVV